MKKTPSLGQEDPLEKLYIDKNKIDRELLTYLLIDYINIDKDTLKPVFKSGYKDLKERQKVLVYLLYRRALVTLGDIENSKIGRSPKEIAKVTGINYNSVRGYLSQLNSLIEKEKAKGGYYIPSYNLSLVKKKLDLNQN